MNRIRTDFKMPSAMMIRKATDHSDRDAQAYILECYRSVIRAKIWHYLIARNMECDRDTFCSLVCEVEIRLIHVMERFRE